MSYMYEVSTSWNSDTIHEFLLAKNFNVKKTPQKFGNKREGKADLFFMFLQMNVQKNRQWQSGIFIIKPSHPWRKKNDWFKTRNRHIYYYNVYYWNKMELVTWRCWTPFLTRRSSVCGVFDAVLRDGRRRSSTQQCRHPSPWNKRKEYKCTHFVITT